ncbi:hypothetical protein [Streptomyces sp. NPDC050264]|uniref:hypothetical protein n=1 Tax=Streptomyces sp. NPDC050264 TaxID=3155038 RepID=UPI003422A0AF
MTTQVVRAQQERPAGPGQALGRGTGLRIVLLVLGALTVWAAGVASTLLYQRATTPDTSAVDAQAASLAENLRADLNVGFYSGGRTYGGQFTQGTLVAQVETHGGALLSLDTGQRRSASTVHTAEVMLGLVPPSVGTVAVNAYPVRCYHYTFGFGEHSVKYSAMPCPDARTDGKPGSLTAQLGALLTRQPTSVNAYRAMATSGYAHTTQGALDFLKEKKLITASDTVSNVVGEAQGAAVYATALRINGVCHYLRLDSSPTASGLIPLWAAPAEQNTCDASQALAATALYGIDPAKAG